ncbi:MAG: CHAP domain-containing protein [Myxococcales bacterium]|nr:CHAP domain-containing protein [Myxococcales bacterium]
MNASAPGAGSGSMPHGARRVAVALITCGVGILASPAPALAVYQCGNQKDDCQCGSNNPYPCCDNGSNCTWWAWESACCNWKAALPGWGNANTWGSNAGKNPNYQVLGEPVVGSIATSTKGTYGHVAWVTGVNGSKVTVTEMNCCGGCAYGMKGNTFDKGYFNSGYVVKKGGGPVGPVCGDGQCNGGESCSGCDKDCGSCCGNGKCDNGEKCSTCQKDCGGCCGNGKCDNGETCKTCNTDCKCPAEGALDGATCKAVWGWASDPDSNEKVSVKVRVGGEVIDGGIAAGDHPAHPGSGFSFAVPAALKNGKPQEVTVDAIDTQTGKVTALGPKAFLCENRQQVLGMWTTTFVDAAGVQPKLPPVAPPDLALAHALADGFAYPLSGSVQSCAVPGLQAFDGGIATIGWQLAQHRAALLVDGVEVAAWQNGAAQGLAVAFGPGQTLCLQTLALAQVPAQGAASVQVGPIAFRHGPWTWSYATPTGGLTLGFVPLDAVQVRARPAPFAGGDGDMAWARLKLASAFQRATWTTAGLVPAGVGLAVHVGDKAFPVTAGAGLATVTGATVLEVRATASLALPADLDVSVKDLRVRRDGHTVLEPWRVVEDGAWGLTASLPAAAAVERGRCVALHHAPAGWWTTGTLTAELRPVPYELARVAAHVQTTLPAGLVWRLAVDGQGTVAELAGGATRTVDFDVAVAGGHVVRTSVTAIEDLATETQGTDAAPAGGVEVRGLRWLAQGWWTAYGPNAVGLHDDRVRSGSVSERIDYGVRLHLPAAPELQGAKPRGTVVVYRAFAGLQTGVRLHIRQDLHPGRLRASVLLDGAPARLLDAVGPHDETVELVGISFREVGVALQVIDVGSTGAGEAGPVAWWLEATDLEVRGADGKWREAASVAAPAAPAGAGTPAGTAANIDAGSVDAKAGPVGAAAAPSPSSCVAARSQHTGSLAALVALVVLAALTILARRRMLPVQAH